ncbi:uncharacterized protein LOC119330881 isoform X4 [Triticum dicoccoides]|uniref:uncharacterized protein LOC119330881 isoform X4 n=1 Tax=Triticum dicoccoides TaxID=85692 RepID=UPI0018914650|nr:uncharacterized protein LOC119330881 isoform X4 [Triticum dicoccoides]
MHSLPMACALPPLPGRSFSAAGALPPRGWHAHSPAGALPPRGRYAPSPARVLPPCGRRAPSSDGALPPRGRRTPGNSPSRPARSLPAAARTSSIDGLHRPLQPIEVVAVFLDHDPHLPGLLWLTCPIADGFLLQTVQWPLPLYLRPSFSPTRRMSCSLPRPYHYFSPGCIWSLFNYRSAPALRTKKGPCDRASIFFHQGRHHPSASRPPCHFSEILQEKMQKKNGAGVAGLKPSLHFVVSCSQSTSCYCYY